MEEDRHRLLMVASLVGLAAIGLFMAYWWAVDFGAVAGDPHWALLE